MRRTRGLAVAIALMLALTGLAACGAAPSPIVSRPAPSATQAPLPTPTPTLDVPSHDVSFTTSDHILLAGTQYGQGKTFVIFSNQTDTLAGDWAPIAQQFAAHGYAALCYDYRGRGNSQGTRDFGSNIKLDLRAAIAYAQRQGAQRIVLVGASVGGALTANVAASTSVAAVAIISAPSGFSQMEVTAATMANIAAPKLLMNSQGDSYAQQTQAMYDAARPPKELHLYPGVEHGIDLLIGEYSANAMQRLLAFVQQYAPTNA